MVIFFKTRLQARQFAAKTARKAPANKSVKGWAIKLK